MRDRLADIGIETREETGRAIALPATTHAMSALVGLAAEQGWIVTPHWAEAPAGSNGGTVGQSRPLFVSTERLAGIEEVAPADLMGVVGAGVTLAALEERIADDGLCWPPSSMCSRDDMVGDVISRLPGGWTMKGSLGRRYLLALEAVLADRSVVSAGARTVKSVTGYDIKQLVVGSRGVLGVVTTLTLRLEALANRESVLERYRQDFAGMGSVAVRSDSSAGGDGALIILERIKRELDPAGVFPGLGLLLNAGDAE